MTLIETLLEKAQVEREIMRDTIREIRARIEKSGSDDEGIGLLCQQILDGHPIGEYILRSEHEARMAAQDAAFHAAIKERTNQRIELQKGSVS